MEFARSPRLLHAYAPDPRVRGGGSDIRVDRLRRCLASAFSVRVLDIGSSASAAQRLVAALHGVPPRLSERFQSSARSAFAAELSTTDLAVVSTTFTAPLVPPPALDRVVLDAHNLEWRVVSQLAGGDPHSARRLAYRATLRWTRSYERRLVQRAAGVWAVSEDEADWMIDAGARVWVVPNGVDLPELPRSPADQPLLLFVGSLASMFNRDGLRWFVDECWPSIKKNVPAARLKVAGAGDARTRGEDVDVVGYVEDLGPLYEAARLCIAPIRSGAGTRLKVLEAMAHARPVVSTRVGAEGLGLGVPDGVLVADDPEAFADACVGLLRDPDAAAELGVDGRRVAEKRFSWDTIGEAATESIRALTS